MSRNPLIPAKPTEITIDTLPQLFAHHRAVFGGWSMDAGGGGGSGDGGDGGGQGGDQPPERPSDIAEAEWNALGDPGKRAIVRERQRAEAAERALAASRARPAPPKPKDKDEPDDKGKGTGVDQDKSKAGEIDVEAIVKQAVEAAIKPFAEREQQRDVQDAAKKVQDAVIEAAKTRLHDATDALTGIDLAGVVNEQGQADPTKITTALDDLIKRKPHLAKTTDRIAPPGIGGGGPAGTTEADKVKAALAEMQRANNVRVPSNASN